MLMSSIKAFLSPSHQNRLQRRGFFNSLAVASLILFLHFPFDGYYINHYVTTRYGFGPCPSAEGAMNMTSEQLNQYSEDIRRCSDDGEMQLLPFVEWKSKAPIIDWFGPVIHAAAALFLLFH